MTVEQILSEYDDELSNEARTKLINDNKRYVDSGSAKYIRVVSSELSIEGMPRSASEGILGGLEVTSRNDGIRENSVYNSNLIPVYECEWIEYDDDKLVRHEGIKIGEEIYITRGESEDIVRSISNPKDCALTINGIFFNDKNGDPFSIVLHTMDLQDRYDLTIYYRDSLLATSGTVGDWIDVAHLPEFLGDKLPERVQK